MQVACSAYYSKGTAFGASGDFITSPEISQIFGELVGIWHVAQWMNVGRPQKVQLIECGPGRGTMMADMLRAIKQFPDMISALDIHLVEQSHTLRREQRSAICNVASEVETDEEIKERSLTTDAGVPVSWYNDIEEIPHPTTDTYTMVVAHEFFDALPIHQFEARGGQWRERLVDVGGDSVSGNSTDSSESPNTAVKTNVGNVEALEDAFHFVLSPKKTVCNSNVPDNATEHRTSSS